MPSDALTLCDVTHWLRSSTGWSHAELCRRLGISEQTLARMDTSSAELPLPEVRRLCSILGVAPPEA